jgi:hypothetical protein
MRRTTTHTTQTQEAHLLAGNAAQIIGKVNPDLSIKVLSSMDLGTKVGKSPNPGLCREQDYLTLSCPPAVCLIPGCVSRS